MGFIVADLAGGGFPRVAFGGVGSFAYGPAAGGASCAVSAVRRMCKGLGIANRVQDGTGFPSLRVVSKCKCVRVPVFTSVAVPILGRIKKRFCLSKGFADYGLPLLSGIYYSTSPMCCGRKRNSLTVSLRDGSLSVPRLLRMKNRKLFIGGTANVAYSGLRAVSNALRVGDTASLSRRALSVRGLRALRKIIFSNLAGFASCAFFNGFVRGKVVAKRD